MLIITYNQPQWRFRTIFLTLFIWHILTFLIVPFSSYLVSKKNTTNYYYYYYYFYYLLTKPWLWHRFSLSSLFCLPGFAWSGKRSQARNRTSQYARRTLCQRSEGTVTRCCWWWWLLSQFGVSSPPPLFLFILLLLFQHSWLTFCLEIAEE